MRPEQNSRVKDNKERKKFDKNLLLLAYVQTRKGADKRSRFQDWAGSETSVNPKKWEKLGRRILIRYRRTYPEMASAFLHFKKRSEAEEAIDRSRAAGIEPRQNDIKRFIKLSTSEIENTGGIRKRLLVVEEHMDEGAMLVSNNDGGLKSIIKLVGRDKKKRRSRTKKTPDIDEANKRQSLATRHKALILNLLLGSGVDNYPERDQILTELIKQGVKRITTPKQLSYFIKRVNCLLKNEKNDNVILCARGTSNKMGGYYLKFEKPHDNDGGWWNGRRETGDTNSQPVDLHTEEAILWKLTNEGMSLENAAASIGITARRAEALKTSIAIKMVTGRK